MMAIVFPSFNWDNYRTEDTIPAPPGPKSWCKQHVPDSTVLQLSKMAADERNEWGKLGAEFLKQKHLKMEQKIT